MNPRRAIAYAPFCFPFSELYGRMNQKSITELWGSILVTAAMKLKDAYSLEGKL